MENKKIKNNTRNNLINKSIKNDIINIANDKCFKKKKNTFLKKEMVSQIFRFFNIIIIILLKLELTFSESYITLKINKAGLYNILYKGDFPDNKDCPDASMHNPSLTKINDKNVSHSGDYNFTEETNIIKLYFNERKNNYKCLFYGCSAIDEIDASHLNTSFVTNMESMFNGLSSLSYINLSNFDTSKVSNMKFMFKDCSSLKSLDLSSFNT